MIEAVKTRVSGQAVIGAIAGLVGGALGAEPVYLSPLALVADKAGKTLYVAEHTAKKVAVFDVSSGKVSHVISMPEPPTDLALAPDGARLFVTVAGTDGKVFVIDTKTGKIECEIPVGVSITAAPVVAPDGKTLYVCNRFTHAVSVIDLSSGKQAAVIPMVREPIAAAITPDGKHLIVANHLPTGPTDGAYAASAVSIVDTAAGKAVATVKLSNGSVGLRGVCVSPDGRYAYVTEVLARYQLPTTQLERGWMNTNGLSIIDVAGKALVNTVLLDHVDSGAANPWGVACSADGKWLCVAHAGTHDVSVIDRAKLHDKLDRIARGENVSRVSRRPEDVPNDLSFLVEIRRRLKLTGNGPRGLVVIGTKAYAAEYFTDSDGVVNIDPKARPDAQSIALGPKTPLTIVRKGEMFFNDADLCFQTWQSCASCHPDARADGLNWDLLNDGLGNPKNTRSMLLAHQTPPAMATGIRDNAEAAVRAGIRHIQFAVRPEADAQAIDAYLKSLEPLPSPLLLDGKPNEAAKRGEKVFAKAGCAACHAGPLYTDLKSYDVGTGKGMEKGKAFDTPTLIEVWRTAPYLHDGRAATIRDVLKQHNADDKHGATTKLTERELEDLIEFVLTR